MALPVDLGTLAPQNNQRQQGVLPQNQLAFLVSEKAADNDPAMSALARAMWQSGNSNDEIFKSTGMWVDPTTNEVLRNISDANASINQDVYQKLNEQPGLLTQAWNYMTGNTEQPTIPLKDLYNHPDLYKSYPWMANVPVAAIPTDQRESKVNGNTLQQLGSYDTQAHTMRINPELDIENQILNINHELYHGRQTKDTGQNLGGMQSNYRVFLNDLTNRYSDALKSGKISSNLSAMQLAQQQLNNYLANHGFTQEQINSNPSFNFYQHLTGESGARLNEFVTYFSRNFPDIPITPSLLQKAMDAGYSGKFDLVPYWQQVNMTDAKTMPLDPSIGSSANMNPMTLAPKMFMQPKTDAQNVTNLGNMSPNLTRDTGYNNGVLSQDRGGGFDRSGPSMSDMGSNNNSAVSGGNQGSLGGRGSFATSPSGGAFSSSYNARERRGGRIG